MNGAKALKLIQDVGVFGLGWSDGCLCSHFEVQGVCVSVSCRKSENCLRVYSSGDVDPEDLQAIAAEVNRQLEPNHLAIRFCDYKFDHANGKWEGEGKTARWVEESICCYCAGLRQDEEAYLCQKCMTNPDARKLFPYECFSHGSGCTFFHIDGVVVAKRR